jgi:hypothetical protein
VILMMIGNCVIPLRPAKSIILLQIKASVKCVLQATSRMRTPVNVEK